LIVVFILHSTKTAFLVPINKVYSRPTSTPVAPVTHQAAIMYGRYDRRHFYSTAVASYTIIIHEDKSRFTFTLHLLFEILYLREFLKVLHWQFLSRDAVHKRRLYRRVVCVCLFVRPSVCHVRVFCRNIRNFFTIG